MKKNVFLIMLGIIFIISIFFINNIKIKNKIKVNPEPVIEMPEKPTEPYGFGYLDDWQKNLYNLLASDTLQIGNEYTFNETKNLEYVKMVVDLYYQNNPTRPSPKTYVPVENNKLVTNPNDSLFKYNIGLGTTNKIRISQWAYTNINEELNKYNAIDKKADEIIASFPVNASDYEKLKIIFDYLVENVEYDPSWKDDPEKFLDVHNAYGALIDNHAICGGFAMAFQYLAIKSNIYCLYVSSNEHAWNIVWLNGNYYIVDTTLKRFLIGNMGNFYEPTIDYSKSIPKPITNKDYNFSK